MTCDRICIRHGPFDFRGGGGDGGWDLGLGRNFFSDNIGASIFVCRPFGPDYFFHKRKL